MSGGGVGWRWAFLFVRQEREEAACAVAARLLATPRTRNVGAEFAQVACWRWRASAVELLPLLVPQAGETASPALAEALATALLSSAARREHAALPAVLTGGAYSPYVRRPSTPPVYDRAAAAELLAAKPVGIGRLKYAPEIFGALLDAGPLTFRQAAQLYNLTFRWPGRTAAEAAPLWLRHAGPTALSRLLDVMTPHLDQYTCGEYYLSALGRMGGHALPALPHVTALIDRRIRIPVNDSTLDAEIVLDEMLLAAALAARDAILAGAACGEVPRVG
ncbi:hypothetical protein [Yinghuangia soli]|uniref:Uncharacterized protein n=1 Tax=Yinghuangia soli TaxID=2908204 RepID=A0AA41U2B0_9ACTN|nr:hypothetical protein [Yinghuangia soli]MCF2530490.1 hypothetical protein [Yinghuangia soli]